ncbi:LAMI_0H02146g1_1 [Lachancea mirantina]|uniref:isoleucine--tRNA ligase n=1 Tax=Lachancea mirantina TaxID=1230905 RepID=A0A1G4KDW3_9SACH|nr:LAMI_0H02146g1_1 [Lachancea mirantina]
MVKPSLKLGSGHSYQKTLLLPKTKFANRSNLQKSLTQLIPQASQEVYDAQLREFKQKLNEIIPEKRTDFVKQNLFVLHDGPPYANGDLHLGHALNKILKDITNRYQLLKGKYIYYKPGWDCHGLPIELKALQTLSRSKLESISASKVRSLAARHATKTMNSQQKTFEQFGLLMNKDDYYMTLHKSYEINQLGIFKSMLQRGLIKRQYKPVYWGTETKTALAEGELEYNESHRSTAAYIGFPMRKESIQTFMQRLGLERNMPTKCLIWTSMAWTVFANEAICYNRKFQYALVSHKGEDYIVEAKLLSQTPEVQNGDLIATFSGSMLDGLFYSSPLDRTEIFKPLLHGEHVTDSSGTGLVHSAPGHGQDDYFVGIENKLPITSIVDHEGRYKVEAIREEFHEALTDPSFGKGREVLSADTTTQILEILHKKNLLLKSHDYVHSYPYDWRSKKPVVIRATLQWFAGLDSVKPLALQSIDNVQFFPQRGSKRLSSFVKGRSEWCISRQRSWGVPIPVFYKKENPDEMLMNEKTIDHILKVFEEKGSDSWFSDNQTDMESWLPEEYHEVAHLYCRGQDTLDVWFDSGSSWKVIEDFYSKELNLPTLPEPLTNMYLEGSDQHRGWFQSSLLTKVASAEKPSSPYGIVLTHGFTLDENGIKMSKSIGNIISPDSVLAGNDQLNLPPLGVDGLRFLVAQSDFTSDITVGPTVMRHVSEALKKLRLTFKFLLGNLQESSHPAELLEIDNLRPIDQYILCTLQTLTKECQEHYESYAFSKVLTAVLYHMNNHLSSFYFDCIKDSLYSDATPALKRKQIQTTLLYILDIYRGIMAPITPLLVQEAWNCLPKQWLPALENCHSASSSRSPMRRPWMLFDLQNIQEKISSFEGAHMLILKAYRAEFHKLADVTKSVETKVNLILKDNEKPPFTEEEIGDILQVSGVHFGKIVEKESGSSITLSNGQQIHLEVEKSDLHKCPRCWKHSSSERDTLCPRCSNAVT